MMASARAMPGHLWVVGASQQQRKATVAGMAAGEPWLEAISAHRNRRGPYTAAGELLRKIVPAVLRAAPELVAAHEVEILSVAPELRDQIPATIETLTSLAVPAERTRYYSQLRTLRLANGIADCLRSYLAMSRPDHQKWLFIDDVQEADHTDQEFLGVLLRRLDPAQLQLIVGTTTNLVRSEWGRLRPPQISAGPPPAVLPQALAMHCLRLVAQPVTSPGRFLGEAQAVDSFIDGDCTSDDPQLRAAYLATGLEQRHRLHRDRAERLESLGQVSLGLGAIPYHRERAGDEEAYLGSLQKALDHCMRMGFYEATVDLCDRGRALVDSRSQHRQWWAFTTKLPTALSALDRGDEAELLCAQTRALTTDPQVHLHFAYATSMLFTRHLAPGRRDHQQALAWINEAIAIASLLPEARDRAFNTVFHMNGLALIEAHLGNPERALELVTEGIQRLDRELGADEHSLHRSVLVYNRAQVLASLNRLEEALADYRAVIAVDPHYPEYHFDAANLLHRLGRDEEALAEYELADRFGPPFPEVAYNRADLLLDRGDTSAALKGFDRALELDPDVIDAYLNRASVLADLGETESAIRDIDRGLGLDPSNGYLLALRGRLQYETGDIQAATMTLRAATDANPAMQEAWALRGSIAFDEGEPRTANRV